LKRPVPISVSSTRRELLTGSAKLGAGALAAGALVGDRTPGASARAAAAQLAPVPALPDPPFTDEHYWAFADWCQGALESDWSDATSSYGGDSRINAGMLVTHSIAAMLNHQGPSRQDARARGIAGRLVQSPPFLPAANGSSTGSTNPRSNSQAHTPGWTGSLDSKTGQQHVSIDPKVAEGLVFAWRAREVLGLDPSLLTQIQSCITATARGRFFAYPNIRLNQANWSSELYAYAAEVTGSNDLLLNDYRKQIRRFLKGARHVTRPWDITNLSGSWSFHRDPFETNDAPENVTSAEYANIVLDFVLRYRQAVQAGMPELEGDDLVTLRAWVDRALSAYWTHSGYMNWDTGLYLLRWHLGRYWAFAMQGLFAIAVESTVRSADEGAWAKWFFDSALKTYLRLALERGPDARVPVTPLFGIQTTFGVQSQDFAARFEFHAARAVLYGLGRLPAKAPPPLYCYDPGIGRLAVTTPSYNTAVMAVTNGAFPYGGVELARLFDAQQRVAGCIGGRGGGGFGVVVENSSGATVLATQVPHTKPPKQPPLTLTRSPIGPIRGPADYPSRPIAGPFGALQVTGVVREDNVQARTTHTFRSDRIETAWTLTRRGGPKLSADVRFPTYGTGAQISAVLEGGRVQNLPPGKAGVVQLGDVDYFVLMSGLAQAGYVVVPVRASSGARTSVVQPKAAPYNPRPGLSLVFLLASASSWRRLSLVVQLATIQSADDAPTVVARLRG
jgi:hypothetical protein